MTDARIVPAEDLDYEAVKRALTEGVGRTVPIRHEERLIEGMTATLLGVDEQDGWLVATFEITDERTQDGG